MYYKAKFREADAEYSEFFIINNEKEMEYFLRTAEPIAVEIVEESSIPTEVYPNCVGEWIAFDEMAKNYEFYDSYAVMED